MDLVTVSQSLLWIGFLALAAGLFALTRQVGLLHERLPAMGALVAGEGPSVGEAAPRLEVPDLAEGALAIGGPSPTGRRTLLLFVADACPVCKSLLPWVESFAGAENVDAVLVGDGNRGALQRMVREHHLEALPFAHSARVGLAFQVGKLPYAVLLDPTGTIVSKGLVNSREHLESLFVSEETGYRNLHEFLNEDRSESNVAG